MLFLCIDIVDLITMSINSYLFYQIQRGNNGASGSCVNESKDQDVSSILAYRLLIIVTLKYY